VQVYGCIYPLTVQRTILKVLLWLLRSLSAEGTCDLPKHLADLLTSDVNLMCIGPCIVVIDEEENQLDDTQYFIELVIGSTCFGHHYVHRQELETISVIKK
jgi:hypothetical protein